MAKCQDSSGVIVVYGDSHAATSPRMLELEARSLVDKALGKAAPVEKTEAEQLSCVGFVKNNEAVLGTTTTASLSEILGSAMGDWVAGYLFDESGSPAPVFGSLHITMAGGHCGDANCTKCDQMERIVDGLTLRECLNIYEAMQRDDRFLQFLGPDGLTTNQLIAAKEAWSAELKRKQSESKEKERAAICVDDDRWEP